MNVMKLLLNKYKVNVNSCDENGKTALITACKNDHIDGVRWLLSNKGDEIDVNIQNTKGWTPIRFATYHSNIEIMKLLIDSNKLEKNALDA